MVFDDNFFQLTNGKSATSPAEYKPFSSVSGEINSGELSEEENSENKAENKSETSDIDKSADINASVSPFSSPVADLTDIPSEKWSSEYGNPNQDYVIESDIIVPNIAPVKEENSIPLVVAIDDDFDTLDLLKIYFARGYEFVPFHGPREAIFYLNEHIPSLILLDSNIHTIKAPKVIDIIRSYKQLAEVPIIFTCDESEKNHVMESLPEQVAGVLSRPISRGNLQYILDKFITKQ